MQNASTRGVQGRRLLGICLIAALCSALTLALSATAPARAACINCETAGAAPTATVTLNGTNRTVTYTFDLTVNGTASLGWNVTITSTTFATSGSPTRRLPTTASTITSVAWVCTSGQLCVTNPTNSVTYPLTVPAGTTAPTAVKFFNASVLTGLGTFTVTPTVAVVIPANAYVGTYTSVLTFAFVSGP